MRPDLPHYSSPEPGQNRFVRALWGVVWRLLFRPSPRIAHRWRCFLLRCFGAHIGRGCAVYPSARIWAPWNLVMEEVSALGDYVDCYCVDRVRLGAHATVSQYSFLCTASHDIQCPQMRLVTAPIDLGPGTWVCAGVFVGPGVAFAVGAETNTIPVTKQWLVLDQRFCLIEQTPFQMLALMLTFTLIRRHYDWFEHKIRVGESELSSGVPTAVSAQAPREHVVVPVDSVNKITLGAIGMARELSNHVTAVHLTDDRESAEEFRERWSAAVPDVPLLLIESPYRAFVAPMLAYLERLDEQERLRVTVILPTFVPRHWWERVLHNRDVLRLRPFLKRRAEIRVVDFPYRLHEGVA